jgi:SOS response regulatory protein OraA/RecX
MGVKARQLKSNKELRYLLRQKGIKSSLIDDFIVQNESDEGQRLKDLVSTKRKNIRYKDDTKLLAYLVRKGYSFSEVKEALAEG